MNVYDIMNNSKDHTLYGLCGGAGSGKTTLSTTLSTKHSNVTRYSSDYRFIGDGKYRQVLLHSKQLKSLDSYIDACNQYNWWDWSQILEDLISLIDGKSVTIPNAYNRDLGTNSDLIIPTNNIILYDAAILGSVQIVLKCKLIFMMIVPAEVRLQRLLTKDNTRRNATEIAARFLITQYSESLAYKYLIDTFHDKIIPIDDIGNTIDVSIKSIVSSDNYIPFKVSL